VTGGVKDAHLRIDASFTPEKRNDLSDTKPEAKTPMTGIS